MNREENPTIVGFHQDEEGAWVADLSCGHSRHLRHEPPWESRPWVLTAEGRASRLGEAVTCRLCAEAAAEGAEDRPGSSG